MLTIKEVLSRGVAEILPTTDSLAKKIQQGPISIYLGIDPTGNQLTLGHAVVLRKLQQFVDLGCRVILLVGNGTAKIGDPTDRDSTRPQLTDQQIATNFADWQNQAKKIIAIDKIEIKHNGDWLEKLNYADMIKLLGQITIQRLLERDMFQNRIKKGLPIFGHEIIYPLLQGYDSVVMEVDLEIGGTDQTFNMLMGRTMMQNYLKKEKWVLTTPIINGTDGRKMSKSYKNFIALNTAPTDMFGQLMSIKDTEMPTYYEIFTDLDPKDTTPMIKNNPRQAKADLALAIVSWLHSSAEAKEALADFTAKFVDKTIPRNIPELVINQPCGVLDLLSKITKLASSNSEARRLIKDNAITLDGQPITSQTDIITITKKTILKVGKRKFICLLPR